MNYRQMTDEQIFARHKELRAAIMGLLAGPWFWERKAELNRLYKEEEKLRRGSKHRAQVIEQGYRDEHLRYLADHPVVWPSSKGGEAAHG